MALDNIRNLSFPSRSNKLNMFLVTGNTLRRHIYATTWHWLNGRCTVVVASLTPEITLETNRGTLCCPHVWLHTRTSETEALTVVRMFGCIQSAIRWAQDVGYWCSHPRLEVSQVLMLCLPPHQHTFMAAAQKTGSCTEKWQEDLQILKLLRQWLYNDFFLS